MPALGGTLGGRSRRTHARHRDTCGSYSLSRAFLVLPRAGRLAPVVGSGHPLRKVQVEGTRESKCNLWERLVD